MDKNDDEPFDDEDCDMEDEKTEQQHSGIHIFITDDLVT